MRALTGLITGLMIVNAGVALRACPLPPASPDWISRLCPPFFDPQVCLKVYKVAAEAVGAIAVDGLAHRVDKDAVALALIRMRDITDPLTYHLKSGLRRLASLEG